MEACLVRESRRRFWGLRTLPRRTKTIEGAFDSEIDFAVPVKAYGPAAERPHKIVTTCGTWQVNVATMA
jgi:hypothetical protein